MPTVQKAKLLTVGVHSKGFIRWHQARRAGSSYSRDSHSLMAFRVFKRWCEGRGLKAARAAGGPSDGLL